jgi:hypothetical protein
MDWSHAMSTLSKLRMHEVLSYMKDHGSSVMLSYGEDDGFWECSWIRGGERYGAFSGEPFYALVTTLKVAGVTDEQVVRHFAP